MKIKTGLCLTLSALLLAQAVGAQQEFEIRIQKLVLNDIASMDEDDMFFKWTLVDGQNNEDIVLFRKKNKDSVMLFHANGKNMSLMGEATWYDDYGRLRCRSYFDYNPAMHAVQKSAPVYPHARSYLTFWGSKQGKEEVFYDNNNDTTAKDLPLFRVSFYKDGKKEGTETEYWKNGNVIRSAEWNNDSMHGAFFENYEHGSKSKAGNYANDRMEGWWYTWYEDGSLKSKTKYTADKPDTVYTYYRGGILSTVNFNPQRYSYKPSFSYDSLGRLMQFAYMNAQREFDSIEVGYYKNGQKEYEVNVKTGKWDGAYTAWYSNGKIKEKGQYKNSIPYGNWFYYDAKGKLLKTKKWQYEEIPKLDEPYLIEAMEEVYDIVTVTEMPEFPGGSLQRFGNEKLNLTVKEIRVSAHCNRDGTMTYALLGSLGKRDRDKVLRFLKEYSSVKIKPFQFNGRSYPLEMELIFLFK